MSLAHKAIGCALGVRISLTLLCTSVLSSTSPNGSESAVFETPHKSIVHQQPKNAIKRQTGWNMFECGHFFDSSFGVDFDDIIPSTCMIPVSDKDKHTRIIIGAHTGSIC